jgi:hypothetical protein
MKFWLRSVAETSIEIVPCLFPYPHAMPAHAWVSAAALKSGLLIGSPKPELDGKAKKRPRGKANKNNVVAGVTPKIPLNRANALWLPGKPGLGGEKDF